LDQLNEAVAINDLAGSFRDVAADDEILRSNRSLTAGGASFSHRDLSIDPFA